MERWQNFLCKVAPIWQRAIPRELTAHSSQGMAGKGVRAPIASTILCNKLKEPESQKRPRSPTALGGKVEA